MINMETTREKYWQMRHGIPELERELCCMLRVNHYDKKQGNDITFSDDAIALKENEINRAYLMAEMREAYFE